MTLGEKIKAARLEKHMTQKQVVGDHITRNMLSQIENGSAVPSVKTLEYLAEVLGLPAGYFLTNTEESGSVPERLVNARRFYRAGDYAACLEALETPETPAEHAQPDDGDGTAQESDDSMQNEDRTSKSGGTPAQVSGYEDELYLLRARAESCLAESESAAGNYDTAAALVQAAIRDNAHTLYESSALRTKALLLLARCSMLQGRDPGGIMEQCRAAYRAQGLSEAYHLTMAEYLLSEGACEEARQALDAVSYLAADSDAPAYRLLCGRLELAERNYRAAAENLEQAESLARSDGETALLPGIYEMLEICWRELEDFRKAYQYASLQLKLRKTEK